MKSFYVIGLFQFHEQYQCATYMHVFLMTCSNEYVNAVGVVYRLMEAKYQQYLILFARLMFLPFWFQFLLVILNLFLSFLFSDMQFQCMNQNNRQLIERLVVPTYSLDWKSLISILDHTNAFLPGFEIFSQYFGIILVNHPVIT